MADPHTTRPAFNQRPQLVQPFFALLLLFALFIFFLILTPIITGLLGRICHKPDAVLRIAMVLQDVLVFILPAVIMALASTRLPARLLAIDRRPPLLPMLLSILALVFSIPAMNIVVEWNAGVSLPESMHGIEETMRELEANAQAVTDSLMTGATLPSLLVSVLIVGVFAGLSEELFFRGGMQRVMSSTRMNMHFVIWTVAFVFSLFHFQFFGFVPRLLLGAYFGYLLWWSKSLWIPVTVHIFNNSLVVVNTWWTVNHPQSSFNADRIGIDTTSAYSICMVVASVLLTALTLAAIYKSCRKDDISTQS